MSFAQGSSTGKEIPRDVFPGIPQHVDREAAEAIWKTVCSHEHDYYESVKHKPPKHEERIDVIPGFEVIRHQSYTEVRRQKLAQSMLTQPSAEVADSLDNLVSGHSAHAPTVAQTPDGQLGPVKLNGVTLPNPPMVHASASSRPCVQEQSYLDVYGNRKFVKPLNNGLGGLGWGNLGQTRAQQEACPGVPNNSLAATREWRARCPAAPVNSLAGTRDAWIPGVNDHTRRAVTFSEVPMQTAGKRILAPQPRNNGIPGVMRVVRSEGQRDFNARINKMAAAAAAKAQASQASPDDWCKQSRSGVSGPLGMKRSTSCPAGPPRAIVRARLCSIAEQAAQV